MRRRSGMLAFAMLPALVLGSWAWNVLAQPLSVDEPDNPLLREPLWECGLFNGAARLPQYNGSDEYSTYVVPLPYFLYRGEVLRAGRDGIKGIFYQGEHVGTDLSMSGNPPVSRDNKARTGMPTPGALVEIGPALKVSFFHKDVPDALTLRGSIRAACSFDVTDDMRAAGEGFRSTLDLAYNNRSLFEKRQLRFGAILSADVIDQEYSDFYYGVPRAYATESRPAYEAGGGYAGFGVSAHATKQLSRRLSVGLFAKWINLEGAAFEDSPLVKTRNNTVLGCALIWQIAESKRFVTSPTGEEP